MHTITHITLTTGDIACQQREDVPDGALDALVPWLRDALGNGRRILIPDVPGGCSALAMQRDGALVVTVYGPHPDIGQPEPLATFGVATRSPHALSLWTMLMQSQPFVRPELTMPGAPWCAVVPYPSLMLHADVLAWISKFEACVAWVWITRNPDVRSVR